MSTMTERLDERSQIDLESVGEKRASAAEHIADAPTMHVVVHGVVTENKSPVSSPISESSVSAAAQVIKTIPGGGMRRIPGRER